MSKRELSGLRGAYLDGLVLALQVMFDLALERLGNGAPVAYERCVEASIGRPPSPSRPEEKRARVTDLLGRAGRRAATPHHVRLAPRHAAGRVGFEATVLTMNTRWAALLEGIATTPSSWRMA